MYMVFNSMQLGEIMKTVNVEKIKGPSSEPQGILPLRGQEDKEE